MALETEKEHKIRFFIDFAEHIKTPVTQLSIELTHYLEHITWDADLDIVKSNVDKLLRDVVNFLDADMMEKGLFHYDHKKSLSLSAYLTENISLFAGWGAQKGIEVNRQIAEDVWINGDCTGSDYQ